MIVQAIVADPQSTGLAHVYAGDEAFVVDGSRGGARPESGMPLEGSRAERLRRLAQLTGLKDEPCTSLRTGPYGT